jgi:hypothetical protein
MFRRSIKLGEVVGNELRVRGGEGIEGCGCGCDSGTC